MTTRGRQIVLAARPKGRPEFTDFRLEETAIPTPAALALQLAQKPALFEVAERSVPSRIAWPLAHVGRAGWAGVVLIDFSNDRRGA